MIGRLADVVQEPAAPAQGAVQADLLGQQAGQKRHLDRVLQHVLRVAGAELEPAQQVEQLFVQARTFASCAAARPSWRMCRSISSCVSMTTSSMRVGWIRPSWISFSSASLAISRRMLSKADDDDDAGRVVDDHVHPGGLLERADVPAFAADDPALHVVGRDVDGGDGRLGGVRRGVTLDGGGEDLASFGGRFPEHLLVLEDQAADLVARARLLSRRGAARGPPPGPSGRCRWSISR